jgi:hypothetical protein
MTTDANNVQTRWQIRNEDTGELIQGQFPAKVAVEIKNNWQQHTALSRSRAIVMFINSENDTLTMSSVFFARTSDEYELVTERINKLIQWSKPDLAFGRPAVCTFWVGNGYLERTCVIDSISGLTYSEPTRQGELRSVSFTLNLLAYQEFNINDAELFETRYHRGRERDYYEMLCFREYKLPMLGDVIRKRNPSQPLVTPGSTIPLPSVEAVRNVKVEPKSLQLQTAYGKKDTPQRTLRIDIFNRRNVSYTSHIVRG